MSKIEANKCYALVTANCILEVIKVLPSNSASFANFFRVESISLRSYELGVIQVAYLHKDVTRDYTEISEEDYQKFFHMWKVYCESLESARLRLERKLSYDI